METYVIHLRKGEDGLWLAELLTGGGTFLRSGRQRMPESAAFAVAEHIGI